MSTTTSKKDTTSFYQRFLHYLNVTDPSTLIYSAKTILTAKENLDKGNYTQDQKDHYQKLVNAAIHPVTGEVIPKLFRVSAIAPVNIPLIYLMLACPATNVPGTLFLHWLNQSYNTACNYANRSGASQSTEQLMQAYGLAVSSACSIAFGLGKLMQKYPKQLKPFGILIPCVATAAANISNVSFTRMNEIVTGSPVFDESGREVGVSAKAGQQCVLQTALTRCVLVPISCLLLPPSIMSLLDKVKPLSRFMKPASNSRLAIELGVIYCALQLALPGALAVYPQTASFNVKTLEPKFHHLLDERGAPIDVLYANKGL